MNRVSEGEPRPGLVLSAAILASGTGFLMNSAMNIAVPTIQSYFEAGIGEIQWILNAYTLVLGSLILASGGLIDRFGLKRVYLSGMYLFLAGSLLCAVAWSTNALIGFRTVQGAGAALMVPGSLAAIKRVYPADGQGKAIGLWAGISGAIAGFGPFLGGYLTELSWRLLFISMLPLVVGAIVLTGLALPRQATSAGGMRGLDYPGFLLSVAGLALLTFGLIRFSDAGGPTVPLLALVAGAVLLLFFVLTEKRRSTANKESLVTGAVFTPIVRAANIATFFLYFAFSGVLFLLSLNLQQLQGFRPGHAGLLIIPATILIPFLSGPSGSLTDLKGPSLQMRLGPLLFALGAALLLLGGEEASYLRDLLPGMLVLGLGMVLVIPAITTSAIAVPSQFVGTASGVNNAASRIAGLFAVAISGALLAGVYRLLLGSTLTQLGIDESQQQTLMTDAGRLLDAPVPEGLSAAAADSVRSAMRGAYANAFRASLGVNIIAALIATAAGWPAYSTDP